MDQNRAGGHHGIFLLLPPAACPCGMRMTQRTCVVFIRHDQAAMQDSNSDAARQAAQDFQTSRKGTACP